MVADNGGKPSSVTMVMMVLFATMLWLVEGVQVMTPKLSMVAPLGGEERE